MAIFKNNPYGGFNFTVVVEGSEPAAFSTVDRADRRNRRRRIPRRQRPHQPAAAGRGPDQVHEPGAEARRGQLARLWEWFDQVRQGTLDRRNIVVTLLNEERQPVVVWKLRRCLPIKYVGPTLSAAESDVAIEEIELAVEGLEIEQIG